MKRILLVEDRDDAYDNFMRLIDESRIEVIRRKTFKEVEIQIETSLNFDAVIMDACLFSQSPNTGPLIQMIVKKGYKKPIIAASSSPIYSMRLKSAGATHISSKSDLPMLLDKLLFN